MQLKQQNLCQEHKGTNMHRSRKVSLKQKSKAWHNIKESRSTIDELIAIIKKLKWNSTPGPDALTGESINWLLPYSVSILLKVCNRQYDSKILEASPHLASVASIYKTGDSFFSNYYGPLQIIYKIMAGMSNERFDNA